MSRSDDDDNVCEIRNSKIMSFYEFWSWQYSRRNHHVITLCNKLQELIRNKEAKAKDTTIGHESDQSRLSYEIFRLSSKIFDIAHYTWQDLLDVDAPSDRVLHDICTGEDYAGEVLRQLNGTRLYSTTAVFDKGIVTQHVVRRCFEFFTDLNDVGRQCITFDPLSPVDELVNDFRRIACLAKCRALGKHPFSGCRATCENGATCQYEGDPGADKIVGQIMANENVAFDPDKPQPRAVGVWLWEYADANACPIAEAIRALKATHGETLRHLGYARTDDRVFRSFYRHTAACIAACEVLSFK